ncbi:MAG: hypothetical protein CXX67_07245 [Thaumarchaeota archaeon]|nr:MAG: hypothetical protein CXX67_07245 [Nitrososphaerota archaeon]
MNQKEKVIVLLSGGLDSTVCLWLMKEKDFELYTITFNYFKRFKKEIQSCLQIATFSQVKELKTIDLSFLSEFEDEKYPDSSPLLNTKELIPPNYISSRNLIYYSIAAWWAEKIGASTIIGGHNKDDIIYFPDTTSEFFSLLTKSINMGTYGSGSHKYQIIIPLHNYTKLNVLEEAIRLDLPINLTWSCQRREDIACGTCHSCKSRLESFRKIGKIDPLKYAL